MAYNFSIFQSRIKEINEWLIKEYSGLRTGQATPAVLDIVQVDSYGSRVPLNQVGNISVEGPRSLFISIWDKGQIKAVEKSLTEADLGLSSQATEDGVRVLFPELTSENRESLKRVAKKKLEDARVSLRKEREDVWDDIQAKEKEGELTEDERFRLKDDLQKIIDTANENLEAVALRKEKEISN